MGGSFPPWSIFTCTQFILTHLFWVRLIPQQNTSVIWILHSEFIRHSECTLSGAQATVQCQSTVSNKLYLFWFQVINHPNKTVSSVNYYIKFYIPRNHYVGQGWKNKHIFFVLVLFAFSISKIFHVLVLFLFENKNMFANNMRVISSLVWPKMGQSCLTVSLSELVRESLVQASINDWSRSPPPQGCTIELSKT